MAYSDLKKEGLPPYRIKGQTRPFIDEDLQLQLPGIEVSDENLTLRSYNPIYSYYSTYLPSQIDFSVSNQLAEIEQAMSEAKQAYEAWKKMKDQLQQALQHYKKVH